VLAKSIPELVFRAPRTGLTVDLEAHVEALPRDAKGKGMYFRDLVALTEDKVRPEQLAERAGIPLRRYVPFLDYPMAELLKLTLTVASIVHPKLSSGDALRAFGRRSYATLLNTHAGRVLLASLGNDIERVFLIAPKAYRLVMNFGRFHSERVEERHVRFMYEAFPSFIETYHVGALEGVFQHFGVEGSVQVSLPDISTGTFDVTWNAKG
jgi:uncharacterized protein (TIGR02265 family)